MLNLCRSRALLTVAVATAFYLPRSPLLHAESTTVLGATGGNVETIVFDPNNSNTVYAGGQGGGISKSVDAGATWTTLFYSPIGQHSTQALIVSSRTTHLILVGEQGGTSTVIARSADGGSTFTSPLTVSDTGSSEGGDCFALAEGVTANTYYAGILKEGSNDDPVSRLWKSSDNGQSWTALTVSTAGAIITDLIQLPNGDLVAGTRLTSSQSQTMTQNVGGIFYSHDDGSTWTSVGSTQGVLGFAYNNNGVLMAATADDNTIYISSSADGHTWSTNYKSYALQAGAANISSFFALRYHAASDSFFLLSRTTLYQSGTGAPYTWGVAPANLITRIFSPVPLTGSTIEAVAIKPNDVNTILIGSQGGDGIYKTADANLGAGAHWSISNTGLNGAGIRYAEKEFPSGDLYAGDYSGMIYFSGDHGTTFTRIFHSSATDQTVLGFAVDKQNPTRLLASIGGSTNRLFLNTDTASTADDAYPFPHTGWSTPLAYPTGGTTGSNIIVRAALLDGTTIYAGISQDDNATTDNYLYKSVDSGTSWTQLTGLSATGGIRALAFDPSDHTILYAGSGDYDFASNEGALHANGLFKSIDAGQHWSALDSNTTLSAEGINVIVVDSTTPSRLWVQAQVINGDQDVWESVDSGAHWTKITPATTEDDIAGMTYASAEGMLLIAEGNAIYGQTPGSGSATWTKLFNVYGNVEVLFNGSAGAGTGTGLYETTSFAPATTTPPTTTTVDTGGHTLTLDPPTGLITLTIPGGAFGQSVDVTLQTPAPASVPIDPIGSLTGQLRGTGVAVEITNNLSLEPTRNVDLTITYRTTDITGLDETKLVIARYDTGRAVWVPFDSTVDTVYHTITAHPNHFSIYQVMQMTPSDTVNTVRIFPNPFIPSAGHTAINFANLPSNARLRIYTLRGEIVQDLTASPAGMASWDGKNKSGRDTVSGVYFVFIEGAGQKKSVKLAIER